jgi:autotransporter-associated beta strand protein
LDSGSTSANDGAVQITSSSALANVASPITFRDNTGANAVGSLQLNGGIIVTQNFSTTCRNNSTTPTFESMAGTNVLSGTNLVQVGGTNVIYQSDAGSSLLINAPIQYVGTLTAARFFVFTGSGNTTVSGSIPAASNNTTPISVIKNGSGTLTLNNANTYTNGTTVLGGTLLVNGSLTSKVNVLGGSLGGNGTISASVTISSGAMLAPGTSGIGTLTINNTLTNLSETFIKVRKTGSVVTNDNINSVSTLVFGGTLIVTNIGANFLTAGDSCKIFSAINYKGAFSTILPAEPGAGLAWNTNNLAVNGTLAVVMGKVQPEFKTATLGNTNLILTASGGAAGVGYSILFSTNLTMPFVNWSLINTGLWDINGNFTLTNGISPGAPAGFYIFHVP